MSSVWHTVPHLDLSLVKEIAPYSQIVRGFDRPFRHEGDHELMSEREDQERVTNVVASYAPPILPNGIRIQVQDGVLHLILSHTPDLLQPALVSELVHLVGGPPMMKALANNAIALVQRLEPGYLPSQDDISKILSTFREQEPS
jgi:hypothetical protein